MPLRCLFVDMNAYFASVEQQERPELRGRPVGVVQVVTDTTCCIAASYEAKRCGVTTGTMVGEARRICPEIQFVEARHELYLCRHHEIVEAVNTCLPVGKVHSIDEMSCRLIGAEREPVQARELAQRIKGAIARRVGAYLKCSIGIGPNVWLSKVASDMQKPDGLTVLRSEDLPDALHHLELTDLPGIARRMHRRLMRGSVTTVAQLCALPESRMGEVWGSRVLGKLWWMQLRGEDLPILPTLRRTVGHSRVLPPEQRTDAEAYRTMVCMTHQAGERMRKLAYRAGAVWLGIMFVGGRRWNDRRRVAPARDTTTLLRAASAMWRLRPSGTPLRVAVTLTDLTSERCVTPPLFEPEQRLDRIAPVMDRLNARYGPHTLHLAAMHGAESRVPVRIAFTHIPQAHTPRQPNTRPHDYTGRR